MGCKQGMILEKAWATYYYAATYKITTSVFCLRSDKRSCTHTQENIQTYTHIYRHTIDGAITYPR